MLDALRAETMKLTRHKATWFLVWLYPVGFTLIFAIVIAAGVSEPAERPSLAEWLRETAMIWSLPGNTLGRYLIAAFVAVAFAGEYGWNTWKLIVPHRRRGALIAAKYAVVLWLLAIAFIVTALIGIAGSWLDDRITGDAIPAGITAAGLLRVHGESALAALAPGLVTIAYAGLAAILTRSTIAALVIAIVALTVEQLIFNFGPMLSMRAPGPIWFLFHALPGYHLANLGHWVAEAAPLQSPFPDGRVVALGWASSLAAAAAWIVGLAALTFASFRRQDIN